MLKDFNFSEKKFLIRDIFINSRNGQATITLPKKQIIDFFNLKEMPKQFMIIPKSKGGKIK